MALLASDNLHLLAFENSLQANIILAINTGKIIIANNAACKLLGYSKKGLLTQTRATIFDITENSFKEMLKQRSVEGHSMGLVTAIKKSGKRFPCEITSAIFVDENGIEKSITTIVDITQRILEQKGIDIEKEKVVADNIDLAISKQKGIDIEKEKVVADNIDLAISKQKGIDIEKEKVVADNIDLAISKQKDIDTEREKVVADNIDLAISKQKDIDIEKEKVVADNIDLAIAKQKTIDVKKEKIVAYNIDLAISKQKTLDIKKDKAVANNIDLAIAKKKTIDVKKEKIVAQNILVAQSKSDAILKRNNQWIKYVAKTSYDVMWDWDIITDEIYVGDSIEEVFGYKVQNNAANFSDFIGCLVAEEEKAVVKKIKQALASRKKNWSDAYKFKRKDGSVSSTTSRASIIRDDKGRAIRMIGAILDVTRLKELEKKLEDQIVIQEELSKIFMVAGKLSFEGIWDWNLVTNEFFLGKGFEELFGYNIKTNSGDMTTDWSNYIHPGDKKAVEKGLRAAVASGESHWEQSYRFIKADGSSASVFNRASIIRDSDGKAYRIIGAMHDISKQKVLEERLEQEIKSKEQQIEDAASEARNTERSDIGKELHDNVNQLLGASRLYLNMAKRGGENSEMFINRSSQYTLMAIEEIRKLAKVLTSDVIKTLGLSESINNVVRDTMETNPLKIFFSHGNFIEEGVSDKFKLNVFRIVQEQLNNILKHAEATEVVINLSQKKRSILLSVSDNGVGFDTTKKRKGIGIANIKSRAVSNYGTADFISHPGKGCVLKVTFPVAGNSLTASPNYKKAS